MVTAIRYLVLSLLKPRELSVIKLCKILCAIKGVKKINLIVNEVDAKTETIKIDIEGPQIAHKLIFSFIEKLGITIKGIKEIKITQK